MGQSTISVRLDDTIKKQFDSLCAEFGMSASTAFNIYARTVVRQRKIPFEITAENDPFYGESNAKILKESIEQMEQHPERNVVKTLEELEDCLQMADISFSERAWEEFQYWMGQDKKTVKRITALLKDISRSPFEGIGKPEPLVGEKGKWSRRINGADRLVYSVDDRGVNVYQCKGHYDDK